MLFKRRISPLQIDAVEVPGATGLIGLLHCPGLNYTYGDIEWNRSLDEDLDALQAWGASALLTLIESHEFEMLGVPDLGERVGARMRWYWIPIPDGGAPDQAADAAWVGVRRELVEALRTGRSVALHCHAGLGRSGTMAASLLTCFGVSASEAIATVRRSRPGAIQTDEQEQYVSRAPRKNC
jgi:ADP-ribosyl-[dinitrogen reductase] hydrolase